MWNRRFVNRIGKLQVATDRRHLEFEDGAPFLYIGDTAWQLFHRLNIDEARHYLADRAEKGFTVIQAVALGELGGLDTPNANGDLPLIDHNPEKPNDTYFRHVDKIVEHAESLGLFIGFLPTWGAYWKLDGRESAIFTPERANSYGRYIGNRYRDRAVIWILGGDQNIESDEERAIIDALALGLREGDGGSHLITFHPRGPGRSAEFLHQTEWLDFNMCQSSHGARDHDNGFFIEQDLALQPPKPSLDGEPRYETMPVGFYFKEVSRYVRFDDYDARQAAYWALMAGACGHTYGHNSIWQMWTPQHKPAIFANIPWPESLDAPGAFQMGHLRRLFEAYPLRECMPAQDMITGGPSFGGSKIRALRSGEGNFALVYSPRGEAFSIDKRALKPKRFKEFWYDPRYGCAYHIHTSDNFAFQTYSPPTEGRGCDWMLIMDDAEGGDRIMV